MKISASITDFPIYTSVETFFKEFKNAGVDGLEIVGGYKNRWSFDRLFYLSKKYDLPINSFHQPIWSGVGAYLDETFFRSIARKNVHYVTFHPLVFRSFDDQQMKNYFHWMSHIQEKYEIHMLLENMSNERGYTKLFNTTKKNVIEHIEKIYSIGEEYGFHFTFDISHAELQDPSQEKIFKKMFPSIANIHMSSFSDENHHLPLTEGDFQLDKFAEFLIQNKYKGLLTLEVNDSLFRRILLPYDFDAIRNSVDYFRKITDKLS